LEPGMGMDFGPFGERRHSPDPTVTGTVPVPTTTRGYTGHEMLDGLDVVHMNGRVFDNRIGRFLQVDPFVQEPGNAQNHNRHTYLWNNPLNATDPSGFIGVKERQWAAVVITIAAVVTQQYWLANYGVVAGSGTFVAYYGAVGAVTGGVSTGSWKGALYGGLTGAISAGIGGTGATLGARALAIASVNGVMSSLQGGSFGHAFLAAGAGVLTPGAIGSVIKGTTGQFVASVIVGGSVSALTGGKFANGAVTAAFNWAAATASEPLNFLPEGASEAEGATPDTTSEHVLAAPESTIGSVYDVNGNGEGQCVEYIQATLSAPHTTTWLVGRNVLDTLDLPIGTAIMTRDASGHYPTSSPRHAAIFMGHTVDANGRRGVLVLDQWYSASQQSQVAVGAFAGGQSRTLWQNGSGSNNANLYWTIKW